MSSAMKRWKKWGISLKKRHKEGDMIATDKQWGSSRLGMSLFLVLHPARCMGRYQRQHGQNQYQGGWALQCITTPETSLQQDSAQEKTWPRLKGELASSQTEWDCPECRTGGWVGLVCMSACALT